MPKWGDTETSTPEEASEFWRTAGEEKLLDTLKAPVSARKRALRVSAGIVTPGTTVFEPGCAEGLLAETLPPDAWFYGIEIMPDAVRMAKERHSDNERVEIWEGDVFEHLHGGLDPLATRIGPTYDWIVVVNFFGMFPPSFLFEAIERFWHHARLGMSVTTFNKNRYKFTKRGEQKNEFASHNPNEVADALEHLSGAGEVTMLNEIPQYNGRKMCGFVYRDTYEGETRIPNQKTS